MHLTNREYFPLSKVLLHLEISFAVINKIPSHSFGAYNWVSWIHISEFSLIPHFSIDIAPHWTAHLFLPYYILYISKQEKMSVISSKQYALFDSLKDPLISKFVLYQIIWVSNLWICVLININYKLLFYSAKLYKLYIFELSFSIP